MAGIFIIYHSPVRPVKLKILNFTINTTFKKRGNIKNINKLKPFKISTKVLMIRSSHEVVTKRKVSIPSLLSWPPSNAHTLSYFSCSTTAFSSINSCIGLLSVQELIEEKAVVLKIYPLQIMDNN